MDFLSYMTSRVAMIGSLTSNTSSPSCSSPLASAVPPRMILPTTTASSSFLTVAPSGSLVFSMRTI